MARMIDLIRESAVPASLMRSAARGALSLPTAEMLEILVLLSSHPRFGEQAAMTLAGWGPTEVASVVSDPQAPPAVLDYLSSPANLRAQLLPALLENPSISEPRLVELAGGVGSEQLPALAASKRIRACPEALRIVLSRSDRMTVDHEPPLPLPPQSTEPDDSPEKAAGSPDRAALDVPEVELTEYLHAHEEEIKVEAVKPFHLVDATEEEQADIASPGAPARGISSATAAAHALAAADRGKKERETTLQKIARMTVGERINLAYRGGRDERSILIRDGARLVSTAVLESPKITDSEVESFAGMRNIGEHVLRLIASKRKYKRNYAVKRLLTANPRCPIEVALPLVKELLITDLKGLVSNKNISDTVRNFAVKALKDKSSTRQ